MILSSPNCLQSELKLSYRGGKPMDLKNPALKPNVGLTCTAGRVGAVETSVNYEKSTSRHKMTLRSGGLSAQLKNTQLLDSSATFTKTRGVSSLKQSVDPPAKCRVTTKSKSELSNRLLCSSTTAMDLSACTRQVTRLASTLTTSCLLNTRPACSTLLLPKPLSTTSALLSQTRSLNSGKTASDLLNPPHKQHDAPAGRRQRRAAKRLSEEIIDDTLSKKPKYNIDWSTVKVLGEEQRVTMELSAPPSVEAEHEDTTDIIMDTKRKFINAMSASLLKAPNFKAVNDPTRLAFVSICEGIANIDPEFILKVAIYSRKDLNIRTVTSFLLAFAAHSTPCRPFLKKYFRSTIVLPSDWIEVAEIYQTFQDEKLNFGSLPTALRKVMVEKFLDFDKYQLGKYNKDKKPKTKNKPMKKKVESRMERFRRSGIAPAVPVPDEDEDEVYLKTFTLKQLIRQLHISVPADHAMSLIGKKYPETREEFYRCKLPGEFDEAQAGKRMRLPIPETWETQVSLRGNKAEVWESLIDHKKLPFMAMLRNIRNMLKAGISEKHHQWVIGKLTDEGSIANSKQFPFRFFSAYSVLDELVSDYEKHQAQLIEMATKLEDADTKLSTLGRGHKKKTKEQRRANQKMNSMRKRVKHDLKYDVHLVERYRKALDTSVELATNYNVPPIPGVTLILVNVGAHMFTPCTTYKGMGKPREIVEVGILLGLMCKHACESSELALYADRSNHKSVSLDKKGILANTASLVNYAKSCNDSYSYSSDENDQSVKAAISSQLLQDILLERKHVDNVIVLSDGLTYDGPDGEKMEEFLKAYRHLVNPRLLFVSINLSSRSVGVDAELVSRHANDVFLAGFSDQLLRFVAERGDSGQITYVENIDAKYNLISKSPAAGATPDRTPTQGTRNTSNYSPAPLPGRSLKWRVAKVFISSTFLDMHGERDILTRFVFPEIRQWARRRLVDVVDVDLRWGVSQHATTETGSLSLCLNELISADYFIAILGERVGWTPSVEEIPAGEEFEWMRRLPQPQSATGLEIQLAMRTKAPANCFYFIRTDEFIKTVPAKYRSVFHDSSSENAHLLQQLKQAIRRASDERHLLNPSTSELFDNYTAKWAGVVDNKPMAGDLEQFALRAMRMMKERITCDYPLEEAYGDELEAIKEWQDGLVEEGCCKFKGRHGAIRDFHRDYNHFNCGVCLIHGDVSVGKTAFWSRISHELSQDYAHVFKHIVCTGYDEMTTILRRMYHEISDLFQLPSDTINDYYELVDALSNLLSNVSAVTEQPLIVMIDGLNYLSNDNNSHTLNWLPETIPKNVVFLLSCTTGTTPYYTLSQRKDVVKLELKSLDVLDKSAIVKENLAKHGKALDESPFNNQMKLLTGKRSANNPLYLMLACEQLRFHGVFEKVNEKIKQMPQTLPKLLDYILSCLEVDFDIEFTSRFMSLLYCLPTGASINDVKLLLAVYMKIPANVTLTQAQSMFQDVDSDDYIPPLTFTQLLHRVNCFIDNYETSSVLRLAYTSVKDAVKKRYIKSSEIEQRCHLVISAYYLSVIESLHPEPQNIRYYQHIIHHLKCCHQFAMVKEMLTSLLFLHSKCSLGLVTSLNTDYSNVLPARASGLAERKWAVVVNDIACHSQFIYKNAHLLLSGPNQLLQLALNEPEASVICQSAREVVGKLSISYVDWVTKPDTRAKCVATIEAGTVVQCSAISADGHLLALGGEDCRVHIYSLTSCEEEMTLVGHAHLISDLCFIGDSQLMSASHDSTVSLWDIKTGHREAVMDKHNRRVSSCASTKLSLLTASWDGLVKMWTRNGKLKNDVCRVPSPINDMSIHPDEVYAAIACWDSTIKIYNILTNKRLAVLHGHKSSVRSISYSNSGHYISSVSLDGEVKLWSAVNGSQMGSFEGHSLPVRDLCFTRDGDQLITAAEDCRVKVWSGQLGLCVDKWPEQVADTPNPIHCLALNSSSTQIAVGTNLGQVMTFDLSDLAKPTNETSPNDVVSVIALCWSRDGSDVLYTTSTGCLCKWIPSTRNRNTVEVLARSNGMAAIHSVQCSSQWMIAFTDASATVTVSSYDGVNKQSDALLHRGAVLSCSFNKDGCKLATGGADCSIAVWTVQNAAGVTLTPYTSIAQAHMDWVTALSWSDSVDQLASVSTDCLVKLWDFTKSTPPSEAKKVLSGQEAAITCVSYKAGCIVSTSMDGLVNVWSQKGSLVTSINCKAGALNSCSLGIRSSSTSEDDEGEGVGDWAVHMDFEESMAADSKTSKAKKRAEMVRDVLVAVGTADGEVQVWSPLQASETEQYTSTSAALSVCCHSDRLISTHLDTSVRIWCLPNSEKVETNIERPVGLRSDYHQITYLTLNDKYLYTGSFDGNLTVWGVTKAQPIWLRQIKCASRAISAITALPPRRRQEPIQVYVGSEDGNMCIVEVTEQEEKVKLRVGRTINSQRRNVARLPVLHIEANGAASEIGVAFGNHTGLALDVSGSKFAFAPSSAFEFPLSFNAKFSVDDLKRFQNELVQGFHSLSQGHSHPLELNLPTNEIITCYRGKGSRHWIGTDKGHIAVVSDTHPYKLTQAHGAGVSSLIPFNDTLLLSAASDSTVKLWKVGSSGDLKMLGKFTSSAPITSLSCVPQDVHDSDETCTTVAYVGDKLGVVHRLDFHQQIDSSA